MEIASDLGSIIGRIDSSLDNLNEYINLFFGLQGALPYLRNLEKDELSELWAGDIGNSYEIVYSSKLFGSNLLNLNVLDESRESSKCFKFRYTSFLVPFVPNSIHYGLFDGGRLVEKASFRR